MTKFDDIRLIQHSTAVIWIRIYFTTLQRKSLSISLWSFLRWTNMVCLHG